MIRISQKLYIICILLFSLSLNANSQGLKFSANNELINNRTSYNVFAYSSPTFSKQLSISFELSLINPKDFGYICRLTDTENNISYSLTFANVDSSLSHLNFNIDGKEHLIIIPLKHVDLGNRRWLKMYMNFNSITDSITIAIDHAEYNIKASKLSSEIKPQLFFGKQGSVVDVPEFAIRKLSLYDQKKHYSFEFNEASGNDVHEIKGKLMGNVDNPNWLINESYYWKLRNSYMSSSMAAINYDAVHDRMLIFNSDSLYIFNFQTNTTEKKGYKNKLPVFIRLGSSFIDPVKNNVYVYELNDIPTNSSTLAYIDLDTLIWHTNSAPQLPQQRHHHNGYYNTEEQTYTIFGGFGNQRFSNEFNTYNINTKQWTTLKCTGDTLDPRFFSGMTQLDTNELIIFGGIGNKTGDQTLGKTYYYDCYKANIQDQSLERVWNIKIENTSLVSTRNMVLSEDKSLFYTLCYPEYIPNSFLLLYQFSIDNGDYVILADTIPIFSERIETNANLYFNQTTKELFCTLQEVQADGSSNIKFYSLSAPPVTHQSFYANVKIRKGFSFFWLFGAFFLALIIYFLLLVRKKKLTKLRLINEQRNTVKKAPKANAKNTKQKKNAIYLFGEFRAYDRNGKDVSFLFSPKIQQLFLLILLNSIKSNIGVTSNQIYSTIWADKAIDKAKNSKGVTLNQIRSILTDFDGIELDYTKNHFKLEIKDPFYCDIIHFNELFFQLQIESFNNKEQIAQIISIVLEGPFLEYADIEYLDKFKNEFENELLIIMPPQLKLCFDAQDYAKVIQLAKILYNIDNLNELSFQYEILSLVKLDLIELAKKRYHDFIIKYKAENNDDFAYTFRDLFMHAPLLKLEE